MSAATSLSDPLLADPLLGGPNLNGATSTALGPAGKPETKGSSSMWRYVLGVIIVAAIALVLYQLFIKARPSSFPPAVSGAPVIPTSLPSTTPVTSGPPNRGVEPNPAARFRFPYPHMEPLDGTNEGDEAEYATEEPQE